MSDTFALQRFIEAQDRGGVYTTAVAELRAGRKRSHWMWFVFPQVAGLGRSTMSRTHAISSLSEAQAYIEHPVLSARLQECAQILTELRGHSAREIFGDIDAVKLRSSMTLFAAADPSNPVFRGVLDAYFDGLGDPATEALIEAER
jgi:uncharacterized protein (DUF1810 family)